MRRLLIANRGEIACRIAATARRMGIATVAIFTAADAASPHRDAADQALPLGPDPRAYLDAAAVLAAAHEAGADALHPGYGFLSENADFAEACLAAGLIWVGPAPAALRALGDKSEAKALAARVGLPCVPGDGPLPMGGEPTDLAALEAAARGVEFPLLIKAAAGGGGRGMRVVRRPEELAEAAAQASSEARHAFGRGELLLERYLEGARHVEAQIFGDRQGGLAFLGERDCSVQRRFQKIIEESPAPGLSEAARARLAAGALALAREVGYVGAGTVEFLVGPGEELYFLEVNPRLQVEHPVTEAVTGLDLVEWQLRVADGQSLPWPEEGPERRGHAIELRLYAEDPAADFLPQTGVVEALVLPEAAAFAPGRTPRFDHALRLSHRQGADYDPLLGKWLVWAPDRAAALEETRRGLSELFLAGLTHNKAFLQAVLDHQDFVAGGVGTEWVGKAFAGWRPSVPPAAWAIAGVAALDELASPADRGELWAFRSNGETARCYVRLGCEGEVAELAVDLLAENRYRVARGEASLEIETLGGEGFTRRVAIDGVRRRVFEQGADGARHLDLGEGVFTFTRAAGGRRAAEADPRLLRAPMYARVKALAVAAGERVVAGQPLALLEAMKLEHRLAAPCDGTIAELTVVVGAFVDKGELVLRLAD